MILSWSLSKYSKIRMKIARVGKNNQYELELTLGEVVLTRLELHCEVFVILLSMVL